MASAESASALTQFRIDPSMTLKEAGPIFLESRRPYLGDHTLYDYERYLRVLAKFFGRKRLEEISADDVRALQQERLRSCGGSRINAECSLLQQILKRVGLWAKIRDDYQAMPLPKESRGRALTEQEEYRLFKVASLNPNWEVCYNFAVLSAHTAAGPGEIRHLRLRDVFLGDGDPARAWIRVREGAKNEYRVRSIPLNKEAFEAVQELLRIGRERGAHLPDHYLIPKKIRGKGNPRFNRPEYFDPTHCVTTFKSAWKEMCAAAEITGFRMYDLRHHCLTRLAEKVPEHVILKIAGHVSPAMLRRYYAHVRDAAVHEAIDGLSRSDGWKPRPETVRKLMPKKFDASKVVSIKKKATQITQETAPEDTSWIDLVDGDDEKD